MKIGYIFYLCTWINLLAATDKIVANATDVYPYDPRTAFDQRAVYKKHPNGIEPKMRDKLLNDIGNPDITAWNIYRFDQSVCCLFTCGLSSIVPMHCFEPARKGITETASTALKWFKRGQDRLFEHKNSTVSDQLKELVEAPIETHSSGGLLNEGLDDECAPLMELMDRNIENTEGLTEQENFEMARKNLDKALLEDFFKKKYQASMLPIYQNAMGLIPYIFVFGGVPLLVPIGDMGSSFGRFVLLNQVGSFIDRTRQILTSNMTTRNDTLLPYEILYVFLKRYMEKSLQEKIESQFAIGLANSMNLAEPSKFFDVALRFPLKMATIRVKEKKEINKFIGNYMSDYPNMLRCGGDLLEKFVSPIHDHMVSNALAREFLYIKSVPGTGKTTFCKKLADLLGIPIITVKISCGLDDFIGNEGKPGALLEAITSNESMGVTNALLLFDEADSFFADTYKVNACKSMFDPNDPHFKSSFLNVKVNLANYLIIFCANEAISNDASGAMDSRVISIDLGDLSDVAKKRILKEEKYVNLQKMDFQNVIMEQVDWDHFFLKTPITDNMRILERKLTSFMRAKRGDFINLPQSLIRTKESMIEARVKYFSITKN